MSILRNVLALPILFNLILPIALFASLTTIISFLILLFRCLLIYIDLAAVAIPHPFLGRGSKPSTPESTALLETSHSCSLPSHSSTHPQKCKASLASSTISAIGSKTPTVLPHGSSSSNEEAVLTSPNSYIGLNASIGPTRDFEGVGGWLFEVPSKKDDGLWSNINSRLKLPADHGRRHMRSLARWNSPAMNKKRGGESENRMAGNSVYRGKAKTPPTTLGGAEICVDEGVFDKGVLMMGRPSASTSSSGISRKEGLIMKAG
ncbi:hypothetical protein BJ875DRAFT_471668 [Amylocarpus encephaloides]|uniref:Uncharacterized protein n=1 Tax=Amylocarpus encephaloides TaxID=45428 RepID=A0A9P7YB24_9HELO|nr:hypothetical protein BJ875DRAFT_471668 [Amylocarpus encephaloides]